METFTAAIHSLVEVLSSPVGLFEQSFFTTLLILNAFLLIRSARKQMYKKDFQRIQITFITVIVLNLLLLIIQFFHLPSLSTSAIVYPAFQQLVWSYNLISLGWLWLKPAKQDQFSVFKHIFLCTALGLFLMESFNIFNVSLASSQISALYTSIWEIFHLITALFLLILFLFYTKNAPAESVSFALLHILSISLGQIAGISLQFSQAFFQLLACFLLLKVFKVYIYDFSKIENNLSPAILLENQNVMTNAQVTKAWLETALEHEKKVLPYTLCKALAFTFCADDCLLIHIEKSKRAIKIICGYSLKHKKHLLPKTSLLMDLPIYPNKTALFHQNESFPDWIKTLLKTIHQEQAETVWYIPIEGLKGKYGFIFLSQKEQWSEPHQNYVTTIMPELVQFLQFYFGEETSVLPENKLPQTGTNSIIDLIDRKNDVSKDVRQVEEELQLVLEEYSRVLKILEEHGKGQ